MRVFLLAALAAFFVTPSFAQQPVCGPREAIVEQLANGYNEVQVATALPSLGGVLEVFASPQGETFTMIISLPDGNSCLVIEGKDWVNSGLPGQGI